MDRQSFVYLFDFMVKCGCTSFDVTIMQKKFGVVEENQRSLKVEDELKKINKYQLWPYRPAPVAYISKTLVTDLSQPHKAYKFLYCDQVITPTLF